MSKKARILEELRLIISAILGLDFSSEKANRLYNWWTFAGFPQEKILDPAFWDRFHFTYPGLLQGFSEEITNG